MGVNTMGPPGTGVCLELAPCKCLYDTYQGCAPTSVQDDGDVELAFKLRTDKY